MISIMMAYAIDKQKDNNIIMVAFVMTIIVNSIFILLLIKKFIFIRLNSDNVLYKVIKKYKILNKIF